MEKCPRHVRDKQKNVRDMSETNKNVRDKKKSVRDTSMCDGLKSFEYIITMCYTKFLGLNLHK